MCYRTGRNLQEDSSGPFHICLLLNHQYMTKYKPWRAVIAILRILISLWNTIKEEELPKHLGGLLPNNASENLQKKKSPTLPDSKCRLDCSVPVLHAWRVDTNLWKRWWTPPTCSIFSSAVLTPWSLRETQGVEEKNLLQFPSSGPAGKSDVSLLSPWSIPGAFNLPCS